jgi:hypothetical protein
LCCQAGLGNNLKITDSSDLDAGDPLEDADSLSIRSLSSLLDHLASEVLRSTPHCKRANATSHRMAAHRDARTQFVWCDMRPCDMQVLFFGGGWG